MSATVTPPPADAEAAHLAAHRLFEQTLREMMIDWRDQGVVLPDDSPLRKYWPTSDQKS